MDDEAKKAFLEMPFKEQLLAIIDGQTFIRNEIVKLNKRIDSLETDFRLYRLERLENDNANK
jgi:hypothetical protein